MKNWLLGHKYAFLAAMGVIMLLATLKVGFGYYYFQPPSALSAAKYVVIYGKITEKGSDKPVANIPITAEWWRSGVVASNDNKVVNSADLQRVGSVLTDQHGIYAIIFKAPSKLRALGRFNLCPVVKKRDGSENSCFNGPYNRYLDSNGHKMIYHVDYEVEL
ncbi:hypothetical protein [Bartonella sp. LJL80]